MTERIAPDYWKTRAEAIRASLPRLTGGDWERAILLLRAYEEISKLVGERRADLLPSIS